MGLNNVGKENGEPKREIENRRFRRTVEDLENNASEKINEQMQKLSNEILREIESNGVMSESNLLDSKYEKIQNNVQTKEDILLGRKFVKRNSLLTDLFENKHVKTIYHIFLAAMFGIFINNTVPDLLRKGQVKCGLELMLKSFSNFHLLLFIWMCMLFCTFTVYKGFHLWATNRIHIPRKSYKLKIWDLIFLVAFITYSPLFMFCFTSLVINYQLAVAECIAALCEVTRFLMKSYAFVRSNTPRVLKYKAHNEDDHVICPDFKKFLYFLFVPTLIYKDVYPRTNTIRWNYVAVCFVEVFGSIFYVSFVFERLLIPVSQDFGTKYYSWQDITIVFLENALAAILITVCTFYGLLHAWMNGFAELLRFGDRKFYGEWWTSTSYGQYYRTWNVLVQEWLYTYIYKDMYEIVCPKNKILAKSMVFFFSAIFHEFIVGFSLRMFFPVLFIEFFALSLIMSSIKSERSIFGTSGMWYTLSFGTGFAFSVYFMEYFGRINCPVEDPQIINYFVPRIFTCDY